MKMSVTAAHTATTDFDLERAPKHSAIGHFFARFGSKRNRSNSPVAPNSTPKNVKAATLNLQVTANRPFISNEEKAKTLDGGIYTNNKENPESPSPPAKPKRHSSPFARVIHRLSMNRKDRSNTVQQQRTVDDHCNLNLSRETVYSTTSPSTANALISDVLTRPAVSENDLRYMSLQKNKDLERSELMSYANTYRSEDNLRPVSPRTPSYLRVSCALNGYRQSYRRPGGQSSVKLQQLPMSIVERRTALFSNASQINTSPVNTSNCSTNTSLAVDNTSTPVRELIAHFDMMRIDSAKKGNTDNGNGHSESIDEASGNLNTSAHNADTTTPLEHLFTTRNSIPLSDQVLGAVFSETPKPSLAQVMHNAVVRTTLPSEPPEHSKHSEVYVESGCGPKAVMANSVRNDQNVNFDLTSAEAYGEMLREARAYLMDEIEKARKDLENEDNMPEIAVEHLRTSSGQADLLLNNKMLVFAELVEKALDAESVEQPVTVSDLSGYWALIHMELKKLEETFTTINEMRGANWEQSNDFASGDKISAVNGHAKKSHKIKPSVIVTDEKKLAVEAIRRREALAEAKRRQREKALAQTETAGQGDRITKMIV